MKGNNHSGWTKWLKVNRTKLIIAGILLLYIYTVLRFLAVLEIAQQNSPGKVLEKTLEGNGDHQHLGQDSGNSSVRNTWWDEMYNRLLSVLRKPPENPVPVLTSAKPAVTTETLPPVQSLVKHGMLNDVNETFLCKNATIPGFPQEWLTKNGTEIREAPFKVPVCYFNPEEDKWISGTLDRGILYEHRLVLGVLELMRSEPDVGLVDIGANLGVYTLAAAQLQFPVVAVEPMMPCVARIRKSASLAGSDVTIVNAAVSDVKGKKFMMVDKQNKGGSYITSEELCKNSDTHLCNHSNPIHTITTDDLLPLLNFPNVVIKVDAEGNEPMVFSKAAKLFAEKRVLAVQMEWHLPLTWWQEQNYLGVVKTMGMVRFFRERGYVPCAVATRVLSWADWPRWPGDILLIHEDMHEKLLNKKKEKFSLKTDVEIGKNH